MSNFTQCLCATIDILLDSKYDATQHTEMCVDIFHKLSGQHKLWINMDIESQNAIKSNLVQAFMSNINCEKVYAVAHFIHLIIQIEDDIWEELMQLFWVDIEHLDLLTLLLLNPLTHPHNSDQIKQKLNDHLLKLLILMKNEITKINRKEEMTDDDDSNIVNMLSIINHLLMLMDQIESNDDNKELMNDIMRNTIIFLLRKYVHNYVLVVDTNNFEMKDDKYLFDKLVLNENESYNIGRIGFEIIYFIFRTYVNDIIHMFELFFICCLFLRLNVVKIENNIIEFDDENQEDDAVWTGNYEQEQFVGLCCNVFSILMTWLQQYKKCDYFEKYFNDRIESDKFDLINSVVLNININDSGLSSYWISLLDKLLIRDKYSIHFWFKYDIFVPMLNRQYSEKSLEMVQGCQNVLYNKEFFAIRGFVKENKQLSSLFPILEIILRYYSLYLHCKPLSIE